MEVLNDAERRYSRKLVDAMLPEIIETFVTMWEDTKKETKDRKFLENYRQALRRIKTDWSNVKVKEHVSNILKQCPLFPRLIAAVFVIHVKILSSIRIDKSSKKINLKLPSNDVFVHTSFIECARDLYEDPHVITDEKSPVERREELTRRFTKCIRETIENLVPLEDIMNSYFPKDVDDFNMGGEDDAPEEPGEDLIEDAVQEQPTDVGEALDAAEAQGGPEGATPVDASELPVPDETPGGSRTINVTPVHKEELFPDAPEVGKKDGS
jgi:Family of unknown function (DUF5764)